MAVNLCVSSEIYTPGRRNSTSCSGTGVKWFMNMSILEHQINLNGSGLPVYHLNHIGSVPQREETVNQLC